MINKSMIYFILLLFVFAVGGVTLIAIGQNKLIFFPEKLPQEHVFNFPFPFEEINVQTENDVTINALHFKANQSKGVVLYFHGNAGSLVGWGYVAPDFLTNGYDLFIIDYRTFGKSTGNLSEKALLQDADSLYNYLLKSYSEDKIIVYGRSLGTGIATKLATKYSPKMLVLETPYYNFKSLAKKHFPFLPVSLILRYKFPTDKWIVNVNCPIYLIHGTSDHIVPYQSSKKLIELIGSKGELFTIVGGGHNNLSDFPEFHQGLSKVLK